MFATSFLSSLNSVPSSQFLTKTPTTSRKLGTTRCRASSNSSSYITELDLYDLMGIESASDQSEIKAAYRNLQKRCHPDIAGPAGHDMAIILNEAYALLSDPVSRQAYDKEQAKLTELKGYTGKPIYSVWCGSEAENRAVFVDEVKCVGCLKCALCAGKTFAIESSYGRARAVAQWADPEPKIQEAIDACPVDCISMVERSDLASLEFLMSRQPRGNVRVGTGNTAGERVSNIFVDVKKFKARYAEAMGGQNSKEKDLQDEARISAVQAIRTISNWLYRYTTIVGENPTSITRLHRTRTARADPQIKKLQEAAAAARNNKSKNKTTSNRLMDSDEYWVPSAHALPSEKHSNGSIPTSKTETFPRKEAIKSQKEKNYYNKRQKSKRDSRMQRIPIGIGIIAAFVVRVWVANGEDEVMQHIGGSLASSVINSSWMQVLLAGITWYTIGVVFVELVDATRNRQ